MTTVREVLAPWLVFMAVTISAVDASAIPILHVHDDDGFLTTVDVTTGASTRIGFMQRFPTDIAFAPDGSLFAVDAFDLLSVDPETAVATPIGPHGGPGIIGLNALVFGTNGELYAASPNSTALYTVDTTTGAATAIGDIGFASAGDLAFNGGDFYMASIDDQLIRIDLGPTVSGTLIGPFGFSSVFGLATGDDGLLYGVAGRSIFTVDTTTGSGSLVSQIASPFGQAQGSSFMSEAIPEPGTIVLMMLGLSFLAGSGRPTRV